MRGVPALSSAEAHRVRRWDAIILGSAMPGLIAAARLAKRGSRVLVIEEQGAAAGFQGVREPFLIPGAAPDGVLGSCLQALGLPLIERRRLAPEEIAVQLALPHARVDVGDAARTIDELTAWGLAKPDAARDLVQAFDAAGRTGQDVLLAAPIVRRGLALLRGGRAPATPAPGPAPSPRARAEVNFDAVPEDVRVLFDVATRALSNLGATLPSDAARARLLGGLLSGGAVFGGGNGWLRGLVRRRAESLFAEFRTIEGPLRLVAVAGQPGIARGEGDEIWAGRTLVFNAPRSALATVFAHDPMPDVLRGREPSHQRVSLHLEGPRDILPECMCDRVVTVRDPAAAPEGTNVVSIRVLRGSGHGRRRIDLVASAVVPYPLDSDPRDEIEAAVRRLLPLAGNALERRPLSEPVWDTDALLVDPQGAPAWPPEHEPRLSSRPSIYTLEREPVAGLGFEGDVLLGWRGGDAIAAELA